MRPALLAASAFLLVALSAAVNWAVVGCEARAEASLDAGVVRSEPFPSKVRVPAWRMMTFDGPPDVPKEVPRFEISRIVGPSQYQIDPAGLPPDGMRFCFGARNLGQFWPDGGVTPGDGGCP
jgi:hypothetical protein